MARSIEYRLHVAGPDTDRVITLEPGVTKIGRQPGNQLELNDEHVSRWHAQVYCTQDECLVADLDSSNGTKVNHERIAARDPVAVGQGDMIEIGPFMLVVECLPLEPVVEEPAALGEASEAEAERPSQYGVTLLSGKAPPPPGPPARRPAAGASPEALVPSGLSIYSRRLVNYLPSIYHTDFVRRFLGLFESILTPIEWNVDNFDLFLDPGTAPSDFLCWLASWYGATFDASWSETKRRRLLAEAHEIWARRGTRWSLRQLLAICLGCEPDTIEIADDGAGQAPFTFTVSLPLGKHEVDPSLVEALIDANKPAHTTYTLEFEPPS